MKKQLLAASVAALLVLAGCVSTTVEVMPRSDNYLVNGLDVTTHHVKLHGEAPVCVGCAAYIIPLTVGADIWTGGLNIDWGTEGASNQNADEQNVMVTELPVTWEVMDAILADEMTAEEYAKYAAPIVLKDLRDHPSWDHVKERAINQYQKAVEEADASDIEEARAQVRERFGIEVDELTPETYEEIAPVIVRNIIVEDVFPVLDTAVDDVADITPEEFRFTDGTWHVDKFVQAMATLNAVLESGDEDLIAESQAIIRGLLDGEEGSFTADELNQAFVDLIALGEDDAVEGQVGWKNLGVGVLWFGFAVPEVFGGQEEFVYYKQVAAPYPTLIPGITDLPRYTVSINLGELDFHDLHKTELKLDPMALPITLPVLKSPLLGMASTGKPMTVSTAVLNIGWENGYANVNEELPEDWEKTGENPGMLELGPMSYEIVSYDVEVPPRDAVGLEVLTTHLDSWDLDEGEKPTRNHGNGHSNYNNEKIPILLEELGWDPGLADILFRADSYLLTKSLDVVLIEEANAKDVKDAGLETYHGAYEEPDLDPTGEEDVDDAVAAARALLRDPDSESRAALNDLVSLVGGHVNDVRTELVECLDVGCETGPDEAVTVEGTGANPWTLIGESGLVQGDTEAQVEKAEATEVSYDTPLSPTAAWAENVYGDGVNVIRISTPEEFSAYLETTIGAIENAETNEEAAEALPSTFVITTAAPGFGGWIVDVDGTPVPASAVVDVFNTMGFGLIQDHDGYSSSSLTFSPAIGTVTGATTAGGATITAESEDATHEMATTFTRVDGEGRPAWFAPCGVVEPEFRTDAAFTSDAAGLFKRTEAEDGAFNVLASGASGSANALDASEPTEPSFDQAYAEDATLGSAYVHYCTEIEQTQAGAEAIDEAIANEDPEAAVAEAEALARMAQDTAGLQVVFVEAGEPAVGSFNLGVEEVRNVEGFDVLLVTDGVATVFGPDVQTSPGDWDAAVAQATAESGFAFAATLDVGVPYPSVFSF